MDGTDFQEHPFFFNKVFGTLVLSDQELDRNDDSRFLETWAVFQTALRAQVGKIEKIAGDLFHRKFEALQHWSCTYLLYIQPFRLCTR